MEGAPRIVHRVYHAAIVHHLTRSRATYSYAKASAQIFEDLAAKPNVELFLITPRQFELHNLNFTVTRAWLSIACPFAGSGWYRHCLTASMADCVSKGSPETTAMFPTAPSPNT